MSNGFLAAILAILKLLFLLLKDICSHLRVCLVEIEHCRLVFFLRVIFDFNNFLMTLLLRVAECTLVLSFSFLWTLTSSLRSTLIIMPVWYLLLSWMRVPFSWLIWSLSLSCGWRYLYELSLILIAMISHIATAVSVSGFLFGNQSKFVADMILRCLIFFTRPNDRLRSRIKTCLTCFVLGLLFLLTSI